ncbi:hypothetical protein T11_6273 [Trichinella zimbabwensis]|uniref:Secreted protein n=1 Tax=Trichinella zimbabwensis TaxID=268475 RepID=A0A0V1HEJ7_9BILA|nr:hypothetical protein T11_6273 [Trichinella zimbabwensis]
MKMLLMLLVTVNAPDFWLCLVRQNPLICVNFYRLIFTKFAEKKLYTRPSTFTLVYMYDADLQVLCKVVSAYEVPHHNSSDNGLIKLGG